MAGFCLGLGLGRATALYGGTMKAVGTVDERGVPGAYRVRLHDKLSADLVAETWSDADGAYTFERIEDRAYYIVAFDHGANPATAAITDQVVLEPIR
jgi:hypothetical protein